MNRYNLYYGGYMNGSVFFHFAQYEWGGVRGLQPHVRALNHVKLPPAPFRRDINCKIPMDAAKT